MQSRAPRFGMTTEAERARGFSDGELRMMKIPTRKSGAWGTQRRNGREQGEQPDLREVAASESKADPLYLD